MKLAQGHITSLYNGAEAGTQFGSVTEISTEKNLSKRAGTRRAKDKAGDIEILMSWMQKKLVELGRTQKRIFLFVIYFCMRQ